MSAENFNDQNQSEDKINPEVHRELEQEVDTKENQASEAENKNLDNKENISPKTTMAFVAYIFFVIPLLTDDKDDAFVKYHVKQSLGLLIAWIVVSVFTMVPVIGWFFGPILGLILVILWIIGVLNALQGEKKPLPLIGKHSEKLNF